MKNKIIKLNEEEFLQCFKHAITSQSIIMTLLGPIGIIMLSKYITNIKRYVTHKELIKIFREHLKQDNAEGYIEYYMETSGNLLEVKEYVKDLKTGKETIYSSENSKD